MRAAAANDYTVFKSPLSDFKRAVEAANLPTRIIYLSHGETYEFHVPAGRVEEEFLNARGEIKAA